VVAVVVGDKLSNAMLRNEVRHQRFSNEFYGFLSPSMPSTFSVGIPNNGVLIVFFLLLEFSQDRKTVVVVTVRGMAAV